MCYKTVVVDEKVNKEYNRRILNPVPPTMTDPPPSATTKHVNDNQAVDFTSLGQLTHLSFGTSYIAAAMIYKMESMEGL